jgi:hypothetical protein
MLLMKLLEKQDKWQQNQASSTMQFNAGAFGGGREGVQSSRATKS